MDEHVPPRCEAGLVHHVAKRMNLLQRQAANEPALGWDGESGARRRWSKFTRRSQGELPVRLAGATERALLSDERHRAVVQVAAQSCLCRVRVALSEALH